MYKEHLRESVSVCVSPGGGAESNGYKVCLSLYLPPGTMWFEGKRPALPLTEEKKRGEKRREEGEGRGVEQSWQTHLRPRPRHMQADVIAEERISKSGTSLHPSHPKIPGVGAHTQAYTHTQIH